MMKTAEELIVGYSDREEWWIAPVLPSVEAPREWRRTEQEAIEDAKTLALKHNCMYEVYKRVCFIPAPRD